LDAGSARLGVDLATREEELEEVSDALLVTDSDDFNALAAYELRTDLGHGHVYRLRPGGEALDLVPAYAEGDILFGDDLTYSELTRRFDAGAQLVEVGPEAGADALDGLSTLFVVSDSGDLSVVTSRRRPVVGPGDKRICLTPIE
jgi:hypothetical protein